MPDDDVSILRALLMNGAKRTTSNVRREAIVVAVADGSDDEYREIALPVLRAVNIRGRAQRTTNRIFAG